MLPENREARRAAFLRWTGGNDMAAALLEQISEIARLADDIVDEADNRQRNVAWLLERTMTVLPQNPFYVRHVAALAPLITSILVQWQQSDEFRASGDPLKHQFGFVMREGVGSLVTAIAALIGGYEFAKDTADDFFMTCHAGSTETVDEWVKG